MGSFSRVREKVQPVAEALLGAPPDKLFDSSARERFLIGSVESA